jgi:hypothetical protein
LVCDSIHRLCVTGNCLGYRPGSLRRIFTVSYSLPLSSRHPILQYNTVELQSFHSLSLGGLLVMGRVMLDSRAIKMAGSYYFFSKNKLNFTLLFLRIRFDA